MDINKKTFEGRKKNYIARKFLMQDYKSIFNKIIKSDTLLKTFGVSSPLKDKLSKNFYDTDDMFFQTNGININVATYSARKHADLIVRYNNNKERIMFIADIPDTFIKRIDKKYDIHNYGEFIATCVLDLVPNGISVEPVQKMRDIKLKLNVVKKRNRYRIISSDGLKIIISFEQNIFTNAKQEKVKLNMLEVRLDCDDDFIPRFDKFLRELSFTDTRLISLNESDFAIGHDYLDIT